MPASNNSKGMPDMSNLLESLIGEMPGMKDLPPDEKKKMKKAIRATSEKVQSLDLEGIFKTALSNDTGKRGKKTAAINALLGDMPPPPPNQIILVDFAEGVPLKSLYTPFWISGELKTSLVEKDIATAAYTMAMDLYEVYRED